MIYLDNAATSWPKPAAVTRAVRQMIDGGAGNPGRTSHHNAMNTALMVQACREHLAQLFGILNPLRICFTANTTDALNLAIKGVLAPGDHVLCSSIEHNSVWRPLTALEERGVELTVVETDAGGVLDPSEIEKRIRGNTRLIAVLHASNVSGSIQPIAAIGRIARQHGIAFLVDAAQTAGSIPIDVESMRIDLLAFPGHKGLLGPQGTGGLYVAESVELRPLKEGGTGSESLSSLQPAFYPDRLESGTLNLPGIAGLNESVRYLLRRGVANIERKEAALTQKLLAGLAGIDGVVVYGPAVGVPRAAVVSFNIRGMDSEFVAVQLESLADIACRPGWHCAGLAHRTLGTEKSGTVRLSPGAFTKSGEIEIALGAIRNLARISATPSLG
jgi:cysteine desulfurase / selenocysteine lyase